ncbi:MAG TPA: carboxypeptidase regulatory-like domain-containing protein [Bryobacteraceae bacterium]|nr:carboxypeptidase regulatory-like domain-containing protein [Bryobacteraceae bacterium]
MKPRRFSFLCATLLVLPRLFAQVNTATIYGDVTDPSGATVADAKVELENILTGARLSGATNSVGEFSFPVVPVGTYKMTVSAAGFRSETREGLVFSAGQNLRLKVPLQIGAQAESVTVASESPLVNAVNAQQQTTTTTREVKELPTARLDWTQLLNVNTGAAPNSSGEVTMNGLAPSAFTITVDGTNATADPEYNALSMPSNFNTIKVISPDAIQEISLTKGIAPAEIAGSMSGNVNIITKGGTNQFHGSLFENNQVAAYNARNSLLAAKTGDTFNQYGGSIGGPIRKDKLFFFGTYEGLQERAYSVVSGTVPTPLFLSQALAANPGLNATLKFYPAPNQGYSATALTASYLAPGSTASSDNHIVARVDYQATSNDQISLRYTHAQPHEVIPRIIPIDTRIFTTDADDGTAMYTHSFGSAVAVTRFGYNNLSLLRLDGFHNVADFNNIGGVGLSSGAGESFGLDGHTVSIEQTFAISKGRHSLKAGFIYQRAVDSRNDHDIPTVTYANFAAMLTGTPSQVTINFGVNPFALYNPEIGGFVQDDFKVNQRLTINIGVRYDFYPVQTETNGKLFNRSNYGFGPLLPPNATYNQDSNNIAPRIGFAYMLDQSGKTVLRGGFGKFTSPHSIFAAGINIEQDSALIPSRAILSGPQAFGLGINFPIITSSVESVVESGALILPWTANAIDQNYPNPFSLQYTLDVERQLTKDTMLSVGYVGNRGIDLNMVRMENYPDRLTNIVPNPAFGTFRYFDSSNHSNYNSLQVSLKKRYAAGVTVDVDYTWSRSMGFGSSDVGLETPPQDNYNLADDYGPTPFDVRHVFVAAAVYDLPFARWVSGDVLKRAAGGWQLSGIFSAQTGTPLNITQSSNYASSRPDYIGGPVTLANGANTLLFLNKAAFAQVPAPNGNPQHDGSIGRNAIYSPGMWQPNLTLAKNLMFSEKVRLQLRADTFDTFNHRNPGGITTEITSAAFGKVTAMTFRSMQLGARVTF